MVGFIGALPHHHRRGADRLDTPLNAQTGGNHWVLDRNCVEGDKVFSSQMIR